MESYWLTNSGTSYPTSPDNGQVSTQTPYLASWVDSQASQPESQPDSESGFYSNYTNLGQGLTQVDNVTDTWNCQVEKNYSSAESQQPLNKFGDSAEEVGIKLVYTLMMCAEAIQCGNVKLGSSLVTEITNELLPCVDLSFGIGKVVSYFIDALSHRLYQPLSSQFRFENESFEVLYHHFYEACPYLKFGHFTANQAILEAFNGRDCVHVVDFGLINGLQWPALIQALGLRLGGPPSLQLTAISSPTSSQSVEEVGGKLAELAKSLNVELKFRVITVSRLEEVKSLIMVQARQDEALAINSIMHFHRLLGSTIEPVLDWIRSLNPKIMTVVEQEVNLNQVDFLQRFTKALHYYSTMFDSLAACPLEAAKPLAELYLQREICNVLCCEGMARVERHEPLAMWRVRLSQSGFKRKNMGQNALKQANMLVTMYSGEGFSVEEFEGCLTLFWHGRPVIAASAWQVKSDVSSSCSSS